MIKSYPVVFIYIFMIMLSIIMISGSNNWLFSWMSFEMSLFGFIPLFSINTLTSEATMKYFLMQAGGSAMFLMSFLLYSKQSSYIILILGMVMKLGLFPFIQWLPSVMSMMSWKGCMILATAQKMGPIIIMMSIMNLNSIILVSVMSMVTSSMLGFNQTLLRPLMAYSSISHSSWIMLTTTMSFKMTTLYMIIYFINTIYLFNSFYKEKNESINLPKLSKPSTMSQMMVILILSGLPPFSMFFFKMNIMFNMINMPMMVIPIILSTYISTYYYFLFFIPNIMFMKTKKEKATMTTMITVNLIPILANVCHNSVLQTH